MAGRGGRAPWLLVAALDDVARRQVRRQGSGPRPRQGQAEAAGRCAWDLCEGQELTPLRPRRALRVAGRGRRGFRQVPARDPAKGKLKPLGDAPGTYVKVKS